MPLPVAVDPARVDSASLLSSSGGSRHTPRAAASLSRRCPVNGADASNRCLSRIRSMSRCSARRLSRRTWSRHWAIDPWARGRVGAWARRWSWMISKPLSAPYSLRIVPSQPSIPSICMGHCHGRQCEADRTTLEALPGRGSCLPSAYFPLQKWEVASGSLQGQTPLPRSISVPYT